MHDSLEDRDHVVGTTTEDKDLAKNVKPAKNAKELITRTVVHDIYPARWAGILSVKTTDTFAEALKVLFGNKILAVPVYDPKRRKYVSILDIVDCVVHFKNAMASDPVKGMEKLRTSAHEAGGVASLANLSKTNPWYPIESDVPLRSTVELFIKRNLRRTPVTQDDEIVLLVTQTDIFNFFLKNIALWGDFPKTPVADIELHSAEVITCKATDTAISAFEKMTSAHVSGLAIVDETGKLIGNISGTDLRNLGSTLDDMSILLKSVKEFLTNFTTTKAIRTPISVKPTDSLLFTMQQISNNKVHRAFVVDPKNKPLAVISMIDCIAALYEHVYPSS
eukprot:TRINITY_DN594_c0_g1_i2.p1 TRINITY_DN594_c0_g1~~TRINITY_DN594_c0_g1_i2.p1  ORF type:complete len:335 (-),score=39.42 TRINITY_DN594_c0_g1_i2:65-1069(-)